MLVFLPIDPTSSVHKNWAAPIYRFQFEGRKKARSRGGSDELGLGQFRAFARNGGNGAILLLPFGRRRRERRIVVFVGGGGGGGAGFSVGVYGLRGVDFGRIGRMMALGA